jgi:hypothetical protein
MLLSSRCFKANAVKTYSLNNPRIFQTNIKSSGNTAFKRHSKPFTLRTRLLVFILFWEWGIDRRPLNKRVYESRTEVKGKLSTVR